MTVFHYRAEIKEGFKEALLDKTIAEDRVYISRRLMPNAEEMPLIVIYTPSEKAERTARKEVEYKKDCTVSVLCYSVLDDDFESTLDQLTSEIETILDAIDPNIILDGGSDIYLEDTTINIGDERTYDGFAVATINFNYSYDVEYVSDPVDNIETVELVNNLNKPVGG